MVKIQKAKAYKFLLKETGPPSVHGGPDYANDNGKLDKSTGTKRELIAKSLNLQDLKITCSQVKSSQTKSRASSTQQQSGTSAKYEEK